MIQIKLGAIGMACALVMASAAGQAQASTPYATVPTLRAEYTGYAHGLTVLKLHASIALGSRSYGLSLGYHTAGLISVVASSAIESSVQGYFGADGSAEPLRFSSAGSTNGTARRTVLTYKAGSPEIDALEPPPDTERDPVPAGDEAHTIDTLSAIAALLHQVATTGRCDGTVRTFDGQRLGDITATTIGDETLAPSSRSSFSGRTLRCDFVGRQLAGFKRSEDQAAVRKPHRGTAWLAALQPGQPMVPVKVIFDHRVLGPTTMYITTAPADDMK